MANHLTPEIGEGKKFKWITNNAMQKFEADRIISKLTMAEVIILLKSVALNGKQSDKFQNHHKEE